MHRTYRLPRGLLWGLLLALLLGGSGLRGQEALPGPRPNPNALVIPINGTQRVQMTTKKRIATVLNQKDTVARVQPVIGDPTSVIITGLDPGLTRVTFTDVDNHSESIDVVVQLDVEYLRNILQRTVPTAAIQVIPSANNTIILAGYVMHAEDIPVILRTANSVVLGGGDAANPEGNQRIINAMRVGGVQQVQLCVVVARVSRSEARNMEFTFFNNGKHHKLDSTLGGSFSANALGSPIFPNEANALSSTGANIVFGFLNTEQEFFGFLQALRQEGLAKILSEPRLVALSGRPASLLDGGEQAVPVPAGLGQVGVQFEEFGTRLNFIPIVLGNGKIHLEVEPEFSTLNAANGVVIGGGGGSAVNVPGRNTQRVHTTVEMEDGQTLVIGGLIQHTTNGNTTKIPLLGDLPFVGTAFRGVSYTEQEDELIIMVTPHLVDPLTCDQLPKYLPGEETRSPDDFELFLEGILEAPRGPRDVCPDHHYVPAWKTGPTAGQFPCAGHDCGANGSCGAGGCVGCGSEMPATEGAMPAAWPPGLPQTVKAPSAATVVPAVHREAAASPAPVSSPAPAPVNNLAPVPVSSAAPAPMPPPAPTPAIPVADSIGTR
jgi:pilus assembly protein CpaC